MPSELERKIQTVIHAAPTTINAAEDLKSSSNEVNEAIKAINAVRLDKTPAAISTKPLTLEEIQKAYKNPANTEVLDPAWKATITKLSADELFKLTYVFMRHKLNTIPLDALIRGSSLAACKALFRIYLEKSMQENPPALNLDTVPPIISEKIQALLQLMYKRQLEMASKIPENSVVVEIYFSLYGKDKTPTEAVNAAITELLKNPQEVILAPSPALSSSSQADLKGANPATLFQSAAKKGPPPLPLEARKNLKMEAPEEINAIVFQERLIALKTDLSQKKHEKNDVAQELLKVCTTLDKTFKDLIDCYKRGNYLPLAQDPILKGISIDLKLAPDQKEKNSLLTLNIGVNLLAKQLEQGLSLAIQKEAKKGSGLKFMSKPDPELIETLTSDTSRQGEIAKILLNPDSLGKLGRPTLQ